MKRLTALLTMITLPMFAADNYHLPQIVDGPTNAVWIQIVTRPTRYADLPLFAIHASQPKPTFSVITGQTNIIDEITGETNVQDIVESVPYGAMDDEGLRSPTAVEWTARVQWGAAQAQAEQYAQLQAIIDSAGEQIKSLEGIIDWYIAQGVPLVRPVQKDVAIGQIYGWLLAEPDAALRDAGNTRAITLLALLSGLTDAGLDVETINAVWVYMQATGQD